MDKRTFIKVTTVAAAGSTLLPLTSCSTDTSKPTSGADEKSASSFTLPKLDYDFDALSPVIDARTMEIHHGKHHAGYVRKLNAAVADSGMTFKSLEDLVMNVDPKATALRNNGGGHFNHQLFWKILSPNPGQPDEMLSQAINAQFGSMDNLKTALAKAAGSVFGSGWAWLGVDADGLKITSTSNQDNPLMKTVVKENTTPLLGIDVWEHAYYLNYKNERGRYVKAVLDIIDWGYVSERFRSMN